MGLRETGCSTNPLQELTLEGLRSTTQDDCGHLTDRERGVDTGNMYEPWTNSFSTHPFTTVPTDRQRREVGVDGEESEEVTEEGEMDCRITTRRGPERGLEGLGSGVSPSGILGSPRT